MSRENQVTSKLYKVWKLFGWIFPFNEGPRTGQLLFVSNDPPASLMFIGGPAFSLLSYASFLIGQSASQVTINCPEITLEWRGIAQLSTLIYHFNGADQVNYSREEINEWKSDFWKQLMRYMTVSCIFMNTLK
ncbi:hypothetical protein EG68_01575 [Paragonimus skrjabini miyazakii]|uniref:Uncharacterized protein n=1 Tax=Paragonimus skrjabini miyazakii TaxID=59628 RepID=A0A8S9Z9J8_9TREM|nr:hypothetical protein EG68_01575 [Paragonimus skrjabini miyazakii]